jgi:predicted alpha/beta-fold hydrolase
VKKPRKFIKLFSFLYLSYCTYEYFFKAAPLEIKYNHKKLKDVLSLNPSLSQKVYYPSYFFPSGHMQTILLLMMNRFEKTFNYFSLNKYSKTTKIINARDGENIYVDFFEKSNHIDEHSYDKNNFEFLSKFNNSNIVIIIPGACGSSGEFYITDVMEKFIAENFKCISINHRGILNFPLLKNRLYHSGYTDDLRDIFDFLKNNIKDSKFFLLGFSMGGNVVTKFVGELGKDAFDYNIYGGSSICGPLDIKKFVDFTEKNAFTKMYSRFFCRNLKSVFKKNRDYLIRDFQEHERLNLLKSIEEARLASEFYKNFIISNFGFKNEEEYEKLASGSTYIKNIKVPFLIMFSEDDPIIPHECIDDTGFEENENVVIAKTKSGGHVGFFRGFKFERWIAEPVVEFIRDISNFKFNQ